MLPPRNFKSTRFLQLLAFLSLFISISYGHGSEVHDEEHSPSSLHRSNLLRNKGFAIVLFFMVPFLGCWLPWIFRFEERYLKFGLLFSAGLFFALSVEHLISDSASSLSELTTGNYPYAYMIAVLGYMITWLTDIIVHTIWNHAEESKINSESNFTERREKEDIENSSIKTLPPCSVGNTVTISQANLTFADVLLLMFALCFHAFFEGLAVGLAGSVYNVWETSVSIILHKFFEGIALGASMKVQDENIPVWKFFFFAFGFAFTAPVGIAVGIILNKTVPLKGLVWTEAVGNGFAAGVFIFVSLTHLMARGFKASKGDTRFTPYLKWSFAFLGCLVYSLIQIKDS